jgi:uncharacterized SAM-binding protein YcdF (DUF218 family)
MTFAGLAVTAVICALLLVIISFPGNADFPDECAVVFGSAVQRGSEAGPGIRRRVRTAVDLLEAGEVERLIFTGGLGEGNELTEAQVMQNVAVQLGVNQSVIQTENASTSTWENIENIRPLIEDCDSTVGISDRYHLGRIRFLSWRKGVEMDVHPASVTASPAFEAVSVIREVAAVLYYGIVHPFFFILRSSIL